MYLVDFEPTTLSSIFSWEGESAMWASMNS